MDHIYYIIPEKAREDKRPYVQLPLPIPAATEKKPPKVEKDKEKRGVYIFEM